MSTHLRWLLAGGLALGLSACLDPLVDDDVPVRPGEVFPEAEAPLLETDAELLEQVDRFDGVGRLVPRLSAFAGGQRVWYWPFGEAPGTAIPIYLLAERDSSGELVASDAHLPIIDSIPGDEGYSPFWEIFFIEILPSYGGEQITSFSAVQDAQRLGIVGEPHRPWLYINCPVVHPDVRLETKSDVRAPSLAYYRGLRVPVFSFELLPLQSDGSVTQREVVQLRREGGELLDEWWRQVDMTGDGDTRDTNTVFRVGLGDADYTPLWKVVRAVVPADYRSIDTNQDDTQADTTSFDQLFTVESETLTPVAGKLVAFEVTETLVNCPLAPESE